MDNPATRWHTGEYSKDHLAILRKTLDLNEVDEINCVLKTFSKTLELMIADFPKMSTEAKIEWAFANASCPDWFGDALTTRIQNSMLVSALLLTVTATNFLSPIGSSDETSYRMSCYFNGLCSGCFLASIFLGVCFIENAMSRAYTWADRFHLIVELYYVKDLAQIFGVIGTLLFPVCLLIPLKIIYVPSDTYALYAIFGCSVSIGVYLSQKCISKAAFKQNLRTKIFLPLTNPTTGRLRPQYQPFMEENEESYTDICERMYRKDGIIEMKGSLMGCLKLTAPQ